MAMKTGASSKNYSPENLEDRNILDSAASSQLCSACISFHRNDLDITSKMVETLRGTGTERKRRRNIWWQQTQQAYTAEWQDNVHKAIEFCDAFIFILSPDSASDPYLQKDLQHATKNGKRIIPVMVRAVNIKNVPDALNKGLSWVVMNDLKTPDSDPTEAQFIQAMTHVMSQLDEDFRHAQYHTTILRRAIEWERHDFEKSLLLRDKDLTRAQHWLSASALGKSPKPTTLHLSFITASTSLDGNMKKRKLIAIFFGVIVTIGIIWPSWGVFFFSLVFSHFFVYFSSNS